MEDESNGMVTLREMAERICMDRSHARKWIKDRGYAFRELRDPASGN